MWRYNYSNELYHYGVKGMKWGVRRSKEELKYDKFSVSATLNRKLPNIRTSNGLSITKISNHAFDRIGSRDDRKVSAEDIIDALTNPIEIRKPKIDTEGRRSQRFIGKKATVNVNIDTGVIPTVWKTGSKTVIKYSKKG